MNSFSHNKTSTIFSTLWTRSYKLNKMRQLGQTKRNGKKFIILNHFNIKVDKRQQQGFIYSEGMIIMLFNHNQMEVA